MAVTDLTNTKWLINSTTCTAGYGNFNVSFNANSQQYGGELLDVAFLGIGYSFSPQGAVATANTIALGSSFFNVVVGDTIEFLSGTDVTNASLISWLTANATQITSGGAMYIGNSTISKMYIGQNEVEKVYLGQDLVYEKQASLISFTIAGTTYQADSGMTWAQWIASAYNTVGFVEAYGSVYNNDLTRIVAYDGDTTVQLTDNITNNTNYLLISGEN